MAQYYQVLNQEEKINNESSIARFYSNDQNERRTVQYVIAPEGTQPFQTQQVVVSSDQLMVLEDQQQQVILDQSQVTYRTSSLIIRDTSGLEFQNNHRQVYYMANRPHQSNQSVVVEPAIPSQAPPLVLNHQLRQNQIGKVNIPVTGGVNSAQVPPLSVGQQSHLQEMKAPVRPNVPAIRAPMNVQYQKAGEPELVGLPDGTFITMAEYQKLVAQQKTLAQPPNIPDSSRVIPTKPTPARKRNPPNRSAGPAKPRNRSKNTKSARGAKNAVPSSPEDEAASAPIHSRVSKPKNNTDDLPMHVNREYQRRQAEALLRQQVQSQPQPQLQAQLQPHPQSQFQSQPQFQTQPQPQTQQQPQTQPQHQTQPQPQTQLQPQTLSQNRNQFIIRPPRPRTDRSQPYRGLPAFLDPSQIQHILDNTPLTEEYSDSIRMLVLLENGEQRLITFTLPKEACDIHEILEQVNVPFQCDTKIDVQETDAPGLNYIVTVGNMPHCVLYQPEDVNPPVQNVYQEVVADILEPPKPPSPEIPKDVPQKLIPGKFALCSHCGYLSEDFNKCTRCKRILPEDVKAISPVNGQGKKIDLRQLADKKFLPTPAKLNGTPKLNLLQKKKPAKGKLLECETVVVSSDDEDDVAKKQPIKNINEQLFEKLGASITISPISKEPSIIDIQKNSMLSTSKHVEKIASSDVIGTVILCRTVRIGSYRFVPPEPIRIDSNGLLLKVPHPSVPNAIKTIKIERHEIIKVLISFQKSLPVLFYYLLPSVGTNIRTILDMVPGSSLYFDPLTDLEESHKRITVLPELISEESKLTLQRIYTAPGYSVLDELTYKEANDILIKTCPKEITRTALGFSNMSEIKTLLTYPPEGRGRISINTEDYICLGQDQFLNDVIIDFYLKYLVLNMPKEKQEKVHIFSTFFYKRLTTKPIKASRKSQPSEVDPNLNAAQKRHARVKTWTKTVNLFEKDFIIIPINENSHWFLAIVCFPGMNGTHTMDGQSIKIEPRPSKKKKITVPVSIGSVTVTAVKEKVNVAISCEDPELSDKDEAEGDESELDSDSSEDAPPSISMDNRPPIKQPCILIFDSLAGASRSRVVATIRDYLTCEYKAKMNADKVYTKDVIKGACPKVPQQTNFTDCGLYLLQYVEEFFTDPIKDYYIPINSLKTWFQEITVTKKREDISNLIKCLMEETGKNLADLPEVLFPTLNGELIDESMDHEDKFADIDEDEPMDDDDEEYIPPVKTKKVKPAALPAAESDSENSRDSPVKNSVSDNGTPKNAESASERAIVNAEVPKPDISEFPKATTDKDTLSYLKAKRIIRHKNVKSEGPDSKKFRSSE